MIIIFIGQSFVPGQSKSSAFGHDYDLSQLFTIFPNKQILSDSSFYFTSIKLDSQASY